MEENLKFDRYFVSSNVAWSDTSLKDKMVVVVENSPLST